jgi:hypothetical protein
VKKTKVNLSRTISLNRFDFVLSAMPKAPGFNL